MALVLLAFPAGSMMDARFHQLSSQASPSSSTALQTPSRHVHPHVMHTNMLLLLDRASPEPVSIACLLKITIPSRCYCGNTLDSTVMQQPDSYCSVRCPGNNAEICGGYPLLANSRKRDIPGAGILVSLYEQIVPPAGIIYTTVIASTFIHPLLSFPHSNFL